MSMYEREEDALVDDFNNGVIDRKTFDEGMRDLRDAVRWEAEEAAQNAYDDVMGRY